MALVLGPQGCGEFLLVQVQSIRTDIDKHRLGSPQDKGIHRGDKCEVGEDDLVAGLDPQQQGRHLQGVRARRGQQHLPHSQGLLQQRVAFLGERAITGDMPALHGLEHVVDLPADGERAIEINGHMDQRLPTMMRAVRSAISTV